jgi:AcrR family transcriptional regulator
MGTRRRGVESSKVRAALIEAASQLINDEGVSAITARRLADHVGVNRHLVHYYFESIDDVLVAVIRSRGDQIRNELSEALASDDPLRVIWDMNSHPVQVAAIFELNALAARKPQLRAEASRYATEFRHIQAAAIARHLQLKGIEPVIPPAAMTLVLASIAQTIAMEAVLDVSEAHDQARAIAERWLEAYAQYGDVSPHPSQPVRS